MTREHTGKDKVEEGKTLTNHIDAKFMGLVYAKVPPESFNSQIDNLAESLRRKFPVHKTSDVNEFLLNLADNSITTKHSVVGRELHMADADGVWGLKVGNLGVSLSLPSYSPYQVMVDRFESIMGSISDVLDISHFSRVVLRNINLFSETQDGGFHDIKNDSIWGTQNFDTLDIGYSCSGAATRHEYLSDNHKIQLQILSSVVMPGRSHIPQEEWDMWKLRGIPIPTSDEVKLLVDISGTGNTHPVSEPNYQEKIKEYRWETVASSFDELHELIFNVYKDIVTTE
jgi:uncharacterized protein (TIGR04255 family)